MSNLAHDMSSPCRLQCWFRSTLAIHLANALRIQRWYRMRCYLRPIEQRAKLKALAEKKL